MKRGVTAPQKLIDINDLPLKNIEQGKGFHPHWCIGIKQ